MYCRTALDNLRSTLLEIGEPRQLVVTCPHCGDNKVIMARQVKKEDVETNPAFAEFLQVSRTNSPTGFAPRRPSTRLSVRSRGSCKHRGTPGHKCSNGARRSSSKSYHEQQTDLITAVKNGSNGRANSIHLMEAEHGFEKPADESQWTWREKWQRFMEERDDYSLWYFQPDHKFRLFCINLTEQV